MTYDLSFQATTQTLESAGIPVGASEAHGVLTGLVCAGITDEDSALAALSDPSETSDLRDYVGAACTQLNHSLRETEFDFEPLLPEDTLPVALRSRALTHWCSGFMTGFYFRNAARGEEASETVGEALTDIADIAQAGGTVSEADLAEIVEYLRVSIQLIYDEIANPESPSY